VSFKAPYVGTFHGALKITFRDKLQSDEEFTVTRELRGHAVLTQTSSPETSNKAEEDTTDSEHAGITVSHDLGIEFSVERSLLDESFAKQTKELVISKTLVPLVSLKSARVGSSDGAVSRCVHVILRGLNSFFRHIASLPRGSRAILSGSGIIIKI